MEKVLNESTSLKDVNIERLKEIFPAAVSEGKIDFDKLKLLLGEEVINNKEVYQLTWPGKSEMINHIFDKSTATLRPNREKSVNFDETNNVYIEGDNYEVLKLLRENYTGKIKCIYIDPPYNTGKDFVYKDDFKESVENYKRVIENGSDKNIDTSGRFHTDWLNMMYSRLTISRELLKKDGVIFISIDDYEQANLKKICDEIFGQENLVCQAIWDLGTGTQAGHFTRSHEYILAYCKSKSSLPNFDAIFDENIVHGALKKISKANPASVITFPVGFPFEGNDAVFNGVLGGSEQEFILSEKMEFKDGKLVSPTPIRAGWAMANQVREWIEGKETYDSKGQKVVRFYFNKKGILFYEKERETYNPKSVFSDIANTKNGTSELKMLFGAKYFDFPKPVDLLKYMILLVSREDDMILDFFSGSATTAHAVMQLNAEDKVENNTEDGGNRKFIMVQLPEVTDEKSEASKAGYKNICEIGQERIRRAANKIKEDTNADVDYGFKVFELDSSNIIPHNENTILREETLLPNRTNGDILYEIIIKHGFPLDVHVEEVNSAQGTYFKVAYGRLFIFLDCINQELVEEVVNSIRDEQGEDDPNIRFVIKEQLFNGDNRDSEKATCEYLLEQYGYKNIKTI